MASITKDQIKEAIKGMSVFEISELVKELEDEFGVSAAPQMMMAGNMMGQASDSSSSSEAAEKTEFKVVLENAGANKIPLIKEVRVITNLGLKEAKELVDNGGVVKEKISKEDAEKIKKSLVDLGAKISIE